MNPRLCLLPFIAIVVMLIAWFALFGGMGEQPGDVSIAVTGDVMFARNMAGVLSSGESPFANVSNVTSNVDLLLINFENAATSSNNAVKSDIPLKCDPKFVDLARANNNTVAALANNHVCDYGIDGMRDTISNLEKANITHFGAGENEDEAHKPVSQVINGRNISIFNYMDSNNFAEYSYDQIPYANGSSPGYSAYGSDVAQKQISEAKKAGNVGIVFMHYGNEYSLSPNSDQTKISHELIDAGADVVIGSHPHVVQGIEMYNGKPIFYSLGDFIFDLQRENTLDSYFVQIDLVNDTGVCTVYPVHLTNYVPHYVDADSGNALLNSLSPKCSEMEINDGIGKLKFNLTEGD